MRFKSILFSVLIAFLFLSSAFARAWNEYRPQDARCLVTVPKTPDHSIKDVPSDVGTLKMHQYMMDYGEYAYLLTYTDYPSKLTASKSAENILEDVVKGSTGDGELIKKIDLTIDGFPGKEYTARKTDFTLRGRVFLVGQRLYQLIAVYPPSQASTREAEVQEFLTSFRLLH